MIIGIGIGYCLGALQILVLVLGIVKASLERLGIGIGVNKVVLLRSAARATIVIKAIIF